jgi:ribosomal protein L37AE/L43A
MNTVEQAVHSAIKYDVEGLVAFCKTLEPEVFMELFATVLINMLRMRDGDLDYKYMPTGTAKEAAEAIVKHIESMRKMFAMMQGGEQALNERILHCPECDKLASNVNVSGWVFHCSYCGIDWGHPQFTDRAEAGELLFVAKEKAAG